MKFPWAMKALKDGKSIKRESDKLTLFIKEEKGNLKRHARGGIVREARFNGESIFADDWLEVKK
jgi:hypothetical protein